MEELKAKVHRICELKDHLVSAAEAEFNSKSVAEICTKEMGDVVDMIKDLAEAEEKCWKACYYKTVLEQMKKAEEEGMQEIPDMPMSWMLPNDRAGYDSWRYANGQYAPKGHGHHVGRHGFTYPYPIGDWRMDTTRDWDPEMLNERMGYPKGIPGTSGRSESRHMGTTHHTGMGYHEDYMDGRSDYGRAYDKFMNSRRHYTETHSEHDKQEMSMHGKEHVMEAVSAMKEIWSEADPDLRKQMKDSLLGLMNDMK